MESYNETQLQSLGLGIVIVYLVILFLLVASLYKIFEKAGKPGWAVIVPVYGFIVLLDIINKPWWWLFLMIIPLVNLIFIFIIYHRLSRSFGKGTGFTIGLLLMPIVFYPILGFGSAQYTPLTE